LSTTLENAISITQLTKIINMLHWKVISVRKHEEDEASKSATAASVSVSIEARHKHY